MNRQAGRQAIRGTVGAGGIPTAIGHGEESRSSRDSTVGMTDEKWACGFILGGLLPALRGLCPSTPTHPIAMQSLVAAPRRPVAPLRHAAPITRARLQVVAKASAQQTYVSPSSRTASTELDALERASEVREGPHDTPAPPTTPSHAVSAASRGPSSLAA